MKDVVAVWSEPFDAGEFGKPSIGAAAGQHGDELDRLGDQRARDGDDGFLDQLLQSAERAQCRARMDGAHATGMPGTPGFQEIERLCSAHLPDRDAIRSEAKGRTDEIGERDDAILGAERNQVLCLALKLAGVFDQNHAVGGLGDFGEQRIRERSLAGRGAAGDENVATIGHGGTQCRGLPFAHDADGDIGVEGEDGNRGFADGESRSRHHGRQQTLKALAGLGQLGGYARRTRVHLGADMMRHETYDAFGIAGRQTLSSIDKPTGQPIDPEPAVGVEHDFNDGGVFQPKRNGGAKCGT